VTAPSIRSVGPDDLPALFAYLDDHLADNGRNGNALFQPIARAQSRFPDDKKAGFTWGLATPVGQPGWRRAWIAVDAGGAIAGHVDLRARPERAAAHRALLGMGVQRDWRRQGLGLRLIGAAAAWARQNRLDWIDLEVLSVNEAARKLYLRAGFFVVGEFPDMFRIDGNVLSYTLMSRSLYPRPDAAPSPAPCSA
jgi:ribosomal protein S18 acetylase RimI-like enzyme